MCGGGVGRFSVPVLQCSRSCSGSAQGRSRQKGDNAGLHVCSQMTRGHQTPQTPTQLVKWI